MPYLFTNFLYNPSQDLFDKNSWKTTLGTPRIIEGNLVLEKSSVLHKGRCFKGDYVFNLSLPDGECQFGLKGKENKTYILFSKESGYLFVRVSNKEGKVSYKKIFSYPQKKEIEYKIVWEKDFVHFYVDGKFQETIKGDVLPQEEMALFLCNKSKKRLLVKYITVLSVQFCEQEDFGLKEGLIEDTSVKEDIKLELI